MSSVSSRGFPGRLHGTEELRLAGRLAPAAPCLPGLRFALQRPGPPQVTTQQDVPGSRHAGPRALQVVAATHVNRRNYAGGGLIVLQRCRALALREYTLAAPD